MNDHNNFFFGRLFPIAASVSLALLNGCAVMHPMREPVDLKKLPVVLDSVTDSSCKYAGCMEQAIEYADQWRRHYYDEAASIQLWRNSMLAPLLPISAISLYRTTHFDNAQKLVGGYAVAGGALYGVTRYFGLPPQQKTYLVASHTLSCTILNARGSLVPKPEFADLETKILKLRDELPTAQEAYRTVDARATMHPDADVSKEIRARVLSPIRKQLVFFEGLHGRAVAMRNDYRTSGEVLRRHVDLIVAETATQLGADLPTPDKILDLIGGFQVNADKIGLGAFPAAAVAPATTPAAASELQAVTDMGKSRLTAKMGEIFNLNKLPVPALDKSDNFVSQVFEVGTSNMQTYSLTGDKLKDLSAKATVEITDKVKRVKVAKDLTTAATNVLAETFSSGTIANLSATVHEAKKPVFPQSDGVGQANGSVFDQLLVALKSAKNIELHATSENALDFKGTFTRPASTEEQAAARRKAVASNKRAASIENAVSEFAKQEAKDAYAKLDLVRMPAEAVYHQLRGIVSTKTTVLKDCKPDAEKDLPAFMISPQVTEVTLTKDKPAEFIVSNNKQIPKVAISGKNTDKIKHEVKLKGDDFVVVVTATDAIPDGEEAVLAITDFTGKRKIEVKIDANVAK